jgi:uncharacterized protein YjiS (DUF1127 family)
MSSLYPPSSDQDRSPRHRAAQHLASSIVGTARGMIESIREHRRGAMRRRDTMRLSNHLLDDIGVHRHAVTRMVRPGRR